MSDFLLTLARRGAGLGSVVQSRDLPPPEIVTAPVVEAAPALRAVPLPAAPAPAGVIQREPLPQAIVSPSAPAAAAVAPLPSPPEPGVAVTKTDSVVDLDAVPLPVSPVTPSASELGPRALPTAATHVEHHTSTRVVELVPAAVAVAPRGDDNQSRAAPSVRTELPHPPPADRLVQVRIGAIEIVGPSMPAPPPVPPPVATPPARVPGFDDFSALRTYAPFHW